MQQSWSLAAPAERVLDSVESATKLINYSTNEISMPDKQFDKLTVIEENVCITLKENKLARVDWEDRQMTKWQERGALEGPWLDSAAPALLPTPQSRQEPLTERLFCRAQAWKIMSIFRDLGFRPGSRYDCYVTPNVVLWLCYRSEDPHHPEKHGGPLCPGSSGRHAWHAWRDRSSKGPTCSE